MITAIIQARMNSRRFPAKIFADLCGKPILQHVVERVREVKSIDNVIVATCYGGGGSIKVFCDKIGVDCFIHEGAENDVLKRFVDCCNKIRTFTVLRVCADSPLFDAQSADALIAECVDGQADYCGYETQPGNPVVNHPNGYFGEVTTVDALERLDRYLPIDASEREHVTQGFYQNQNKFKCHWLKVPGWYRKEKLKNAAIDTVQDLERVRNSMEVNV